jgi:hypothetical protein
MWSALPTDAASAGTQQQWSILVRMQHVAPARLAPLVRTAAAAALLIGYADLVRGGTTAAPLLLVVGYMLLVPAAILTWR